VVILCPFENGKVFSEDSLLIEHLFSGSHRPKEMSPRWQDTTLLKVSVHRPGHERPVTRVIID
jgi:hypothetical protein